MKRALLVVFTVIGTTPLVNPVVAAEKSIPDLKVGQAIEIEGDWEEAGLFIAEDIELLPQERRPKLRGAIETVARAERRFKLYGLWIHVTEKTQFLDAEFIGDSLEILQPKKRVEVSCKIDTNGTWIARHIRVGNVKESDKIKGTISAVTTDGLLPDTLDISGLHFLVTEKTDVFRTLGAGADDDSTDASGDENN
ncbi:MAG TPA: DUF5666 domain-containing protein [candidate division Zixibacteria bacterium]|nr:DUF5666 domain-containing protein [candidate division Zixibacteria bacterium]